MFSPLEQFELISLTSSNFFFWVTNLILYYILYILLFICFLYIIIVVLMPFYSPFISYINLFFNTLTSIKAFICINSSICNFFLNWFYFLFFTIFFSNIFGLLPYSLTLTSHILVTLFLSFLFFFWITLLLGLRYPKTWISIFVPSDAPLWILFLLVPIELLSYNSRLFSLSIRLFANMMSGHTLFIILSSFLYMSITLNFLYFIPIFILCLLFFLEFGVALLQIYVFLVLCSLYLVDAEFPDSH